MKKLCTLLAVSFISLASLAQSLVSISPAQAYKGQSLSVTISGQNTHFNQGTQTIAFKQGTVTYFYGTSPSGTSTSLSANVTVPLTVSTGYYDLGVQNATDGQLTLTNGFLVTPNAPVWPVTVTGITHSIVVPQFATITVDNAPVSNGDYLGVFYEYGGALVCGGYIQWNGTTQSITAYGDPTGVNGFTSGETFTWKIWKIATNLQYVGTATYQGSPTFPNTNTFVSGGSSGISALAAFTTQTQTLNIPLGWSLISTFINPTNPAINQVLAPIVSNLVIAKNGSGQLYWPVFNINQIGNMVVGQGYQLNLNLANSLTITGSAVVPQVSPVNIPQGWSFLGYLRQTTAPIATMLASITSSITIVKDAVGNVYWPVFGVNSIVNMVPGKGYQIRMINAATLYYPANNEAQAKSAPEKLPHYFGIPVPTGSNMTLGIPSSLLEGLGCQPGDELACFSENGLLVGSAIFQGENLGMTIWGQDVLGDKSQGLAELEPYQLVVWKKADNQTLPIQMLEFSSGKAAYEENQIAVLSKMQPYSWQNGLDAIFPNPVKASANIRFRVGQESSVLLEVFDFSGKRIQTLADGQLSVGSYSQPLEVSTLKNGQYLIILTINGFTDSRVIQVLH